MVLGTAQLGLDYGLTNKRGKPSMHEVNSLLRFAKNNEITKLDTAAAYGNSEEMIGLSKFRGVFDVVTKFRPSQDSKFQIQKHLDNLRAESLYAILFHTSHDLCSEEGQRDLEVLRWCKKNGLVKKIGYSAYTLEDIRKVENLFPDVDLLQIPANPLSQEVLTSASTSWLKSQGTEVHVRSVFLQGVLLQGDDFLLPQQLNPLRQATKELSDKAREMEITRMQLILGAFKDHDVADGVIIGTGYKNELIEVVESWNDAVRVEINLKSTQHIGSEALDPRTWKL